jgi:hypothetical protein
MKGLNARRPSINSTPAIPAAKDKMGRRVSGPTYARIIIFSTRPEKATTVGRHNLRPTTVLSGKLDSLDARVGYQENLRKYGI